MARMRERFVKCPVCKKEHWCMKIWYMYKSAMWIGYICMLYCQCEDASFPVYKLYDENYRYVGYTYHLWPSWDFSHEEVPF